MVCPICIYISKAGRLEQSIYQEIVDSINMFFLLHNFNPLVNLLWRLACGQLLDNVDLKLILEGRLFAQEKLCKLNPYILGDFIQFIHPYKKGNTIRINVIPLSK